MKGKKERDRACQTEAAVPAKNPKKISFQTWLSDPQNDFLYDSVQTDLTAKEKEGFCKLLQLFFKKIKVLRHVKSGKQLCQDLSAMIETKSKFRAFSVQMFKSGSLDSFASEIQEEVKVFDIMFKQVEFRVLLKL